MIFYFRRLVSCVALMAALPGCFQSASVGDEANRVKTPLNRAGSDDAVPKATDRDEPSLTGERKEANPSSSRTPDNHRSEPEICDSERHVAEPTNLTASNPCASHADCKDGENGRCERGFRDMGFKCTYDTCFADEDCGVGKVCHCGGDRANQCLNEGNCWTDGDCGFDGYCSPTLGSCGHYAGFIGYYCHTADDACVDDSDCANDENGFGYCAYNLIERRWMCGNAECIG